MPRPVAFVTGASTGIGFETARTLAAAGFTVYAGARRVEKREPPEFSGVKDVALDVTGEGRRQFDVTWYHATKFAVEGLSDSLRIELRPHGTAVHAASARRPKTRYPVGAGARGILLLRRLQPDRASDAVLSVTSTSASPGSAREIRGRGRGRGAGPSLQLFGK